MANLLLTNGRSRLPALTVGKTRNNYRFRVLTTYGAGSPLRSANKRGIKTAISSNDSEVKLGYYKDVCKFKSDML